MGKLPFFTPNYPYHAERPGVLSIAERTGAPPQYSGRGVVIAFVDSGFYPHPDLRNRIVVHVEAATSRMIERRRVSDPRDFSWHGQMTSVIACGDGSISGGRYRGLAWGARLVLIRVSNHRGGIKEADILRGLEWLCANHRRYGVRIVNVAVGGDHVSSDPEHPLHRAVRRLTEAGVVVLVAAGNAGSRHLLPPASAAEAITVGGYDDRNDSEVTMWQPYHNSFGSAPDGSPKPDVIGPAAWIASPILPGSTMDREARWLVPMLYARDEAEIHALLRAGYADLSLPRARAFAPDAQVFAMLQARIYAHKLIDARHQHVEGTSVSVAVAASVVAQMLEANPRLTPAEVRAILCGTAKRLPNVPPERQGAGIIDAQAAVLVAASLV